MTVEEANKSTWAKVKGFFITYDAEITMALAIIVAADLIFGGA